MIYKDVEEIWIFGALTNQLADEGVPKNYQQIINLGKSDLSAPTNLSWRRVTYRLGYLGVPQLVEGDIEDLRANQLHVISTFRLGTHHAKLKACLLYTSDAADE